LSSNYINLVEEIYTLQKFVILNKIYEKKKTLSDAKVKEDLVDILYGKIKEICGGF